MWECAGSESLLWGGCEGVGETSRGPGPLFFPLPLKSRGGFVFRIHPPRWRGDRPECRLHTTQHTPSLSLPLRVFSLFFPFSLPFSLSFTLPSPPFFMLFSPSFSPSSSCFFHSLLLSHTTSSPHAPSIPCFKSSPSPSTFRTHSLRLSGFFIYVSNHTHLATNHTHIHHKLEYHPKDKLTLHTNICMSGLTRAPPTRDWSLFCQFTSQ